MSLWDGDTQVGFTAKHAALGLFCGVWTEQRPAWGIRGGFGAKG